MLFVGEMLTATAMGYFQHEIEKVVVLALFVPLIISSGGNSGSQATSLIIRSLAVRELKAATGCACYGARRCPASCSARSLASLAFCASCCGRPGSPSMARTMPASPSPSLSLVGVVTFGTICGSMLPFLLRRLGLDPDGFGPVCRHPRRCQRPGHLFSTASIVLKQLFH